jgi:phage terminase large subunit
MNKELIYKPYKKQSEFINSTAKETLFAGAVGASKSYALCLAILKEVKYHPQSQILLCRQTYTSLKRSTMVTLLQGDAVTKPILPKGSYKFNKVEQKITINGNGSDIYLMGIEDILRVRSMNLSLICVDEVSELNEEQWNELTYRLRSTSGSRRIMGATNPSGPSSWLYRRFFLDNNPNRKVIRATSFDNPALPKDYIDMLKDLPKQLYSRFAMGEWIALDNIIYNEFSREKHLKHREYGEFTSYMLGVDFGFTNPCAIGLLGVDGDNNIHLIEEHKESKLLIGKIVELCERYRRLEPVVIVDPSAPALIAEFEKEGFNVKKADNEVDGGIARMMDYLHKGKFTAEPSCIEFIKEVENYIRDDKGKIVKVNDHILDLCRYCCNNLVTEDVTYNKPTIYFGQDLEEDE